MKKLVKSEEILVSQSGACSNCDWQGDYDVVNGNCPECGSELVEIAPPMGGEPQSASDDLPGNVSVVNKTAASVTPTYTYSPTAPGSRGRDDDNSGDVVFPSEEANVVMQNADALPAGWEPTGDAGWARPLLPGEAEYLIGTAEDTQEPMSVVKSLTGTPVYLETDEGMITLTQDGSGRYLALIEPNEALAGVIDQALENMHYAARESRTPDSMLKQILAGEDIKKVVGEGAVSDWLVQTVEYIMDVNGLKGENSFMEIHDAVMNSRYVDVGDAPEDVMRAVFTKQDIRELQRFDAKESIEELSEIVGELGKGLPEKTRQMLLVLGGLSNASMGRTKLTPNYLKMYEPIIVKLQEMGFASRDHKVTDSGRRFLRAAGYQTFVQGEETKKSTQMRPEERRKKREREMAAKKREMNKKKSSYRTPAERKAGKERMRAFLKNKKKTASEARSSTIRLSTLDIGDKLELTLTKPMGKIVAGLVTVSKEPLKSAKQLGATWMPTIPSDYKYRINDRFGNEVVIDYAKAMEVLR